MKLNLASGSIYGLIGPSGCGKTRLLTALADAALWPGKTLAFVCQQDSQELLSEDASGYELSLLADVLGDNYLKVLKGLGFSRARMDVPARELSGGWRQRLSLCLALLSNPDVLLADECTNGLDLAGIRFLETFLANLKDALIVLVSHDRAFLANACTDVLYFDLAAAAAAQQVKHFPGDYGEFEKRMAELAAAQEARVVAADKQRAKASEFVASRAHETDPNKQRQAREKIDKMERIGNFREDGRRYKTNSLKAMSEKSVRLPSKTPLQSERRIAKEAKFNFVQLDEAGSAATRDLVRLDNVSLGYVSGHPCVLQSVTLALGPRARVALLGLNGEGKSTLLACLSETNGGLQTMKGNVERSPSARVAYISQQAVDDLARTYPALSPVQYLGTHVFDGKATEHAIRSHLGAYGLGGDSKALGPIATLSGGEKMRLVMAASFAKSTCPNMLILDEPTVHLDAHAIRALGTGLNEYKGAIVVSTHDRRFLLEDCAFDEVWVAAQGLVKVVPLHHLPDQEARQAMLEEVLGGMFQPPPAQVRKNGRRDC
jgi:ATP-binding cassette subfamily F protein 3